MVIIHRRGVFNAPTDTAFGDIRATIIGDCTATCSVCGGNRRNIVCLNGRNKGECLIIDTTDRESVFLAEIVAINTCAIAEELNTPRIETATFRRAPESGMGSEIVVVSIIIGIVVSAIVRTVVSAIATSGTHSETSGIETRRVLIRIARSAFVIPPPVPSFWER